MEVKPGPGITGPRLSIIMSSLLQLCLVPFQSVALFPLIFAIFILIFVFSWIRNFIS